MSFRRGACPALSAPMQTGDGLLVRLATAGAGLTPAQLIALCAAAERHGNGLVEITARGNFQIRGLTADSAASLARDIAAMDLGLRDGVPVETNPLAGLDPSETADAAPLAAAIREAIDATDLKGRLAPKVSVIVDGGGTVDLSDLSADVRLTAVRRDPSTDGREHGHIEWLISTGGDAAAARPLGVVGDDAAAVDATLTVLEALAARGRDARARDLAPAEMKAVLAHTADGNDNPPPPPPEPVLGPASGRTRGAVPFPRERGRIQDAVGRDAGSSRAKRGRGTMRSMVEGAAQRLNSSSMSRIGSPRNGSALPLTDGRFALPVALPFGSVEARELIAFLEEPRHEGATELRLAPGRGLILICETRNAASDLRQAARAAGLVVDADDPRARIFACPGSAGCASGHIAAREVAEAVARALGDSIGSAELHISGCPKGCAHPAAASLTLVGTENGPFLVENGTARDAGMPFGDRNIAARLADAVERKHIARTPPDRRVGAHGEQMFAGD